MRLIDVEPVLHFFNILRESLPEEKREVIDQAISVLEMQPELPVEWIKNGAG